MIYADNAATTPLDRDAFEAMCPFLLAYYGEDIPIMGLPGCVMYAKRTVFDLVLPRILAGEKLDAEDLAVLGEGGLCLSCPDCTFPNCGFGKGA